MLFDEIEEDFEELVQVQLEDDALMLKLDAEVENFEDSHFGLGERDDGVSVLGDVGLVLEVFLEVIEVVFCVFFNQGEKWGGIDVRSSFLCVVLGLVEVLQDGLDDIEFMLDDCLALGVFYRVDEVFRVLSDDVLKKLAS